MKKVTNLIMFEKSSKVKQTLQKILLPLEFIISIIMIYSVYKLMLYKYTSGFFHLTYTLLFIPTFIINSYLILFNIKNNRDKIHKVVISFLIPTSIAYIFFMVPTYAPDEHAHVWKAYEISTGKLITPIKQDGTANIEIPDFFIKHHVFNIAKYNRIEEVKQIQTNYNQTQLIDNPASSYPAILYMSSSIGFLIARIININGIFAIYLARILNTIVFLITAYYSIKIIPFGKKILTVILFLPMMLQQCTSVSADSFINCITIFYIAYILKLCTDKKTINKKQIIIFTIMSIAISISKITYYPLIGLSLLFIGTKNMKKETKKIFIPTVIIVSTITAIGYYLFMQQYPAAETAKVYMEANNVKQSEQIKYMLQNPLNIIRILKNTLLDDKYIDSMIGLKLGWLDIEIHSMYITAFFTLLVMSPFIEKNKIELNKLQKLWFFAIALASYWLVFIAMYIGWSPVGNTIVQGVQGRYFLPVLPLVLIPLCKKENYIKIKNINICLPTVLSILNMYVIFDIFKFFV